MLEQDAGKGAGQNCPVFEKLCKAGLGTRSQKSITVLYDDEIAGEFGVYVIVNDVSGLSVPWMFYVGADSISALSDIRAEMDSAPTPQSWSRS